jgi:peptidoglycan/xylan/chitin deacetylase (PgdA/CDA1 family)
MMRSAAAFALAVSASLLILGPASAQLQPPPLAPAPSLAPAAAPPALAPAPAAAPTTGQSMRPTPAAAQPPALAPQPQAQQRPAIASAQPACSNPNALGVTRTVEIDTTGGPGFGFEHFKQHDFLRDKEVVLTFDDGPWLNHTAMVLKALADECVKATFFAIGKHATYYPEILRLVVKAGHTVGSHTWSHQDLSKKTPEEAKDEIEKAISAVKWALEDAGPQSPFFRFPALRHPPEMVTYLGQRNIAMFSTDLDSFDFKIRKPDQIVKSVMTKLDKRGKGIILMHDFQAGTAHAIAQLLAELKAKGYKVVHMKAASVVTTLPEYDEQLMKELAKENHLPTVSQRPTSSVVKTVD